MNGFFETLSHMADILLSLLGAFVMALIGVLMRYGHLHSQGEEWKWSRLLLDLPTVIVMGVLAGAIGKYLQQHYSFPEEIIWALSANFGYFGPKLLDRVANYIEQRGK